MSSEGTGAMSKENDEKSALVPRRRFPEFREAGVWGTLPLRNVAQLLDGDWIESKDQSADGVRLIQTGNIGIGDFIPKDGNARFISEETFRRLKCTEVVPGDCLISRLPDPAGRSCLVPDMGSKMITAVDCTVVRFNLQKIVPYLFISFSQTDQYFSEVQAQASGSTRLRISRENLSNIKVPLASLPEQQKIADCLSSLDELITTETQKLDALKTHKKGLMQQLFPREGETVPRLRFPDFRDAGEWEEKSIGDFGEVITGSTPSTARPEFYGGGMPFVSPADISDLRWVNDTKTTLTASGFEETRPIKANSVLFVCIGSTIGKVTQNVWDCATNQQINSVIPNAEHSGGFLYYALSLNSERIANLAGIQAVPIINKTQFSAVRLSVPELPEQERIADCLSFLDDLITTQSKKIDAFKAHKKGLMQQLFPVLDEVRE